MKIFFDMFWKSGVLATLLFSWGSLSGQVQKLTLDPSMVVNECGYGVAGQLVDEQVLAGNPLGGQGGAATVTWNPGYLGTVWPASAYIDLGQVRFITRIYFRDVNSSGLLTVSSGTPQNWTPLFSDGLTSYNVWKFYEVNASTRYVRFTKANNEAKISEVVIYHDPAQAAPAFITDLSTDSVTTSTLQLTWTDISGGGTMGNPVKYLVRSSLSPITSQNFDLADPVILSITPGQAGLTRHATIRGLIENTTYYFAMKVQGTAGISSISNLATVQTGSANALVERKLILQPWMLGNVSGLGNAGLLIDEQTLAGNPAQNSGGSPATNWVVPYGTGNFPAKVFLDFGKPFQITRVFVYDSNGQGLLKFSYGTPGNWTSIATLDLNTFNSWREVAVNQTTRYIGLSREAYDANFSEIVVYYLESVDYFPETKLGLTPQMVVSEGFPGEPKKLVDEQAEAGDPLNAPGGITTESWDVSPGPFPASTYLDLNEPYALSRFFMRDMDDAGILMFSAGQPGHWEGIFSDSLTGRYSWNQHNLRVDTRYLRLSKFGPGARISELVLYGTPVNPPAADVIPPSPIQDLEVIQVTDSSVTLRWTNTGDDLQVGRAEGLSVRFSLLPLTEAGFSVATRPMEDPEPGPAGTQQECTLYGLLPRTGYSFAMIAFDEKLNASALSNVVQATTGLRIGGAPVRITLTPAMILNEYAHGDATLLVDEQATVGDPLAGQGGNPQTSWNPGSTSWYYPCYATIDLGTPYLLSDLFLFDAGGSNPAPVRFFTGTPFSWQPLCTDSLLDAGLWKTHAVNDTVRYLRVEYTSANTFLNELVLYGTALEPLEPAPQAQSHARPLFDEFVGINAFVDDPMGRMQVAGFVREYHNWMWIEGNTSSSYPGYPNNLNAWNLSYPGWNFDLFYDNLARAGITVCPDIKESALFMIGFNQANVNNKPVLTGQNPELPASYIQHADHMFQNAARYGATPVADNLLKLKSDQPRSTGLNLIRYYENWNEQDKWWKQRAGYFTPYEYAAMSSADFDGHQGNLGNTLGIRNADPNSKLVMAGLAEASLDYIRAMKSWFDHFRGGDFPIAVLNVHHYSHNGTGTVSATSGVSPEQDQLREKMALLVDYRNTFLPGKEVWVTEFGYDTHQGSVQRAPAIGSFSPNEVQAQWLVRSYLALAAAGVDKAAMYMLRDASDNNATKYESCGLTSTKATGWQPKTSWYYVYTLRNRLAGMRFAAEIPSGNSNVRIYRFQADNSTKAAYVIWCPTSNQVTVPSYQLALAAGESNPRLVTLTDGQVAGVVTTLAVSNGLVSLSVSERPVIVLVNEPVGTSSPMVTDHKLVLLPSMVTNESTQGSPSMLVDEQTLSGEVDMGTGGAPVTNWSPGFNFSYPAHAYIDLGQEYDVTKIYLRDMNGSGSMVLSSGTPGNWTPLFTDNLSNYNGWNAHVVNTTTRYIRVSRLSASGNMNEIVIYVK